MNAQSNVRAMRPVETYAQFSAMMLGRLLSAVDTINAYHQAGYAPGLDEAIAHGKALVAEYDAGCAAHLPSNIGVDRTIVEGVAL